MTESTTPKPRKKRITKAEKELLAAEKMKEQNDAIEDIIPKSIENTKVFNVTILFRSGTKITLDNYFEFVKDDELGLWKGQPSEISEQYVLEIKDECVAAVIYAESIATGGKKKIRRR